VAADPSRKAALLVPAAQLFGAAIGPAGASAFIVAGDFRPVTWFAAGCALASLALLITLVILSRSGKEH
jgi:DHA1 family inner membrane transport protein